MDVLDANTQQLVVSTAYTMFISGLGAVVISPFLDTLST